MSFCEMEEYRRSLADVRSDVEKCDLCKRFLSEAICLDPKKTGHPPTAIGLTYVKPKTPLEILFIAESPPEIGFFYDPASPNNAFREKLFKLLNKATPWPSDLRPIVSIDDFNDRGYFLADAINCRWRKYGDKSPGEKSGKKLAIPLDKVLMECSGYLYWQIVNLMPRVIVLVGTTAANAYYSIHERLRQSKDLDIQKVLVLQMPFILTAPVHEKHFVNRLMSIPR